MEESKATNRGHNERGRGQPSRGRPGDKHPRRGHRGGHGRGGKPYETPFDEREQHQRRPNTEHVQQRYNQNRGGHGQRGNYNRGRGGPYRGGNRQHQQQFRPQQINAPKDSYYYKYFYGPYPEIKEIEVTLETEIPKITEENKVEVPSSEEYAKHMKDCDDQIQELRSKITSINDKKRAVTSSRKQENHKEGEIDHQGKNFKQILGEKMKLINQRKELNNVLESHNQAMGKINEDLRKMSKFIDKDLHTIQDVDKTIKEINKELQTTSMPVAKEKEMYKRVTFLEKSKQYYEIFEGLRNKVKVHKDKIYETKGAISKLGKPIKQYNAILDELNNEQKSKMENKDKISSELEQLEEKVQEVKTQIGALFEKKNEIREQHYKSKFLYEHQLEEIAYYDYLAQKLDKLKAQEKERLKQEAEVQKREEEKIEKKKTMANPFQNEINMCVYLITQLKLEADGKRRHEEHEKINELLKERTKEQMEEIKRKEEEGKIQVYQKEEDIVVGKKHKKKNKQKVQNQAQPKPIISQEKALSKPKIEIKLNIVRSLIELGIDVPEATHEQINNTIKELEKQKESYEERGQKKIDEIFHSKNWEDIYEKEIAKGNEEFIVHEEDEEKEEKFEKKPRQKRPQKYVKDDENYKPLADTN